MIPGCRTRRGRADSGLATVELVLVIAVPVLMLSFVVLCGRVTESRLRVEDAAHQAARAASTARSADAARERARTTVAAVLGEGGVECRSLAVEVEGAVRPGETVTAVVTCRVELSDLAALGIPGTAVIRESFASPVDVYRGVIFPTSESRMP